MEQVQSKGEMNKKVNWKPDLVFLGDVHALNPPSLEMHLSHL